MRAQVETSAGGVIYRWCEQVPHVLLIRDPYGHWGLPKGHLEEGETPPAAALREVREETGLCDLALGAPLGTIDWYFRNGARLVHKFCHFYLIECPSGDTCPQQDEGITDCRWLPIHEAVELITYENARDILKLAADTLERAPIDSAAPD